MSYSRTPLSNYEIKICKHCRNFNCNNTFYKDPSYPDIEVSCYILSGPWLTAQEARIVPIVKKTVIKTKKVKITITKSESKEPNRECPVCMENTKDHAFECGHGVCGDCAKQIGKATNRKGQKGFECPECRTKSKKCIKLYF